ncbi:hypothetical protein H5410_003163 [Solanum commersonii]|uniref:Uncharacterized protein n=1 Tax=Solanum commersonii TaxID=4109 RepID=A0A9J6B3X7_SOLCO|nr:hypothetical protein H5410_003163 [Solanum commersonii]
MKSLQEGEQRQQGNEHKQMKTKSQEEQQHQNSKEKSNQQQSEQIQKIMWRPTSPQNKMSKEQPQIIAQQTGTSNTSNHNSFTNLNIQEKHNEDIQEHNCKEEATTQGLQIRFKADQNQRIQVQQAGNKINNKSTCIDSVLPIPTGPNNSHLDDVVEVEGGMDRGCQEKQTNMQEGVSKGGNLTHVMHEGFHLCLNLWAKSYT